MEDIKTEETSGIIIIDEGIDPECIKPGCISSHPQRCLNAGAGNHFFSVPPAKGGAPPIRQIRP